MKIIPKKSLGQNFLTDINIINKIIDRAISEKKITLYGNGNYVRDFIYLEDVIMGIIYALKNYNKLHKDYYYLTTEIEYLTLDNSNATFYSRRNCDIEVAN